MVVGLGLETQLDSQHDKAVHWIAFFCSGNQSVTPAQAGVHRSIRRLDSRLRGNDE